MSKRKREIQKRKKQQEPRPGSITEEAGIHTASELTGGAGAEEAQKRDDIQVAAPDPKPDTGQRATRVARQPVLSADSHAAHSDSLFSKSKEKFLLGLLVLYVFLLGLGTVGELFEIEWILNLRLFR